METPQIHITFLGSPDSDYYDLAESMLNPDDSMVQWYPLFRVWYEKVYKQLRPLILMTLDGQLAGCMVLKPTASKSQKHSVFPDSGKICAWRISDAVQKQHLAGTMLEHLLFKVPFLKNRAWRFTAPEEFGLAYAKVIAPYRGKLIAALMGRYREHKKEMVFMIPPQKGSAADIEHFEITDPRSLGLLNRS
ncbi:MAG: hypothetical protein IJU65_04415 [Desulfovibrio sp.]|nr:hypothetical protein [Desulfovibrio sp.]